MKERQQLTETQRDRQIFLHGCLRFPPKESKTREANKKKAITTKYISLSICREMYRLNMDGGFFVRT